MSTVEQKKKKRPGAAQGATSKRCDPKAVEEFDYSGQHVEFEALSRPARRALITQGILTPRDLSRFSLAEVRKFHGIGPASFPILKRILKRHGLGFRG
jgi:hypothetical protein